MRTIDRLGLFALLILVGAGLLGVYLDLGWRGVCYVVAASAGAYALGVAAGVISERFG